MNVPLLKGLNLDKYWELIRLGFGEDCPFALCDSGGLPVWTSDGEIGNVISRLNDQGFEWATGEAGAFRQSLGDDRVLVYEPVTPRNDHVAWLAVLVKLGAAHLAELQLRGADSVLRSLGACIGDEYRLNYEVISLADALSQRQDELNLVYSLEEATQRSLTDDGLSPLLKEVGVYTGSDLVAFARSPERSLSYALTAEESLSDLDAVLSEIRGPLFSSVTTSSEALVLNSSNDPRRQLFFSSVPCKVLALPVTNSGKILGMLVLVRNENARDFSTSDRSMARVVAGHVGAAMRNRTMLGEMRTFGKQLATALVGAAEADVPTMEGHSACVHGIAVRLGRELGMRGQELENLFWGSIMHDVGNVGVPEAVFSKPGSLTDEEYALVKTHSQRSYEILGQIEGLRRGALDTARYHHERWDGDGYPFGLQGPEIPIQARIVAVADTYTAITSARAHRPALPHQDALAEILRIAGTQLDPEVVSVFVHLCESDASWLDRIRPRAHDRDG